MKTRVFRNLVAPLVLYIGLVLSSGPLFAEDAPTYRGKVVLIVDNTIDGDTNVSPRIQRLINDLTGDGWRVLRHDVNRGPQHPDDGITTNVTPYNLWAQTNGPQVREIRALIKADYDDASNDVKNVFLLGHIPVPYSGDDSEVDGGHYNGAQPSDLFYGDTTSPYGAEGWSDITVDNTSAPYPEFFNTPGDGKFDQLVPPSPLNLGVGRVDLFDMPTIWAATNSIATNETMSIAQYLDKDHDFRCANFAVQRQSIMAGWSGGPFCLTPDPFEVVFGTNITDSCGEPPNWPIGDGADYLMGYAGGFGGPFGGISFLSVNTLAAVDEQVVFMNIFGSFVGDWDEQDDLLRAVLANPYDPANGRYGYGLTAVWSTLGLDGTTLTNRALGATVGEALFVGYTGDVNFGLMGDPTLRMHSVQGPSNLTASATTSTVALSWTASLDTNVSGYNVYSAPTPNGPYTLVNTNGAISNNLYTAMRPASNGVPDNFYMVRAIKPETTLVGNYINMSEGITVPVASTLTPYLTIVSQPVNEIAAARTQDGVTNAAAFSVDAVGCDALGNSNLTYQWYEGTNALSDNGHYQGANTSALLISGLQDSDAGSYNVVVSNSFSVRTSSSASLTIKDSPIAVGDSYTIIRNTVTNLDVLANDSDPDGSALSVVSISSLNNFNAGTVTINPGGGTINFIPAASFLGTTTFTYDVSDGFTASQATVTLNVVPNPNDQPPAVIPTPIPNQTLSQYATIEIPFSVSDQYTAADDLQMSVTSSDSTIIPINSLTIRQGGTSNILQIQALAQTGTCNITLSIEDYDLQVTTLTFGVTVMPANVPALVASGLESDGFHFTVNDSANSTVEIKESSDLVTWTSLGDVVLTSGLYNFVDNSANSATQRFYSASDANGCSVNTIGFVNMTVPAKNTNNASAFVLTANPLNNPNGNTLSVLYVALTNKSEAEFWEVDIQSYMVAIDGGTPPTWNTNLTLDPGIGAAVHEGGTNPVVVTYIGNVPQGQQINPFTTTQGDSYLLSSVIPLSGTMDQLGFPAVEGDQIQELDNTEENPVTVATYSGGAWTPAAPIISAAESFFLVSGGSTNRTWTENLSTCSPEVTLTSPTDGSTFVGPASITLSATATSGAGISTVQFFQGTNQLGVGTQSGSTYTFDWIGPATGAYSITAQATDNSGITTISVPANINIYAQPILDSESYSNAGFEFTIEGSDGVTVDLFASTNLVTWSSLGPLTLPGGSSNYVDAAAGSFTQRFYRVQENGVCSSNTIGFVNVTVPTENSSGGEAYISLANPLNNPAGNTLDVLFWALTNRSQAEIWDSDLQSYIVAGKGGTSPTWNTNLTLNPGMGSAVHAGGTNPIVVTFVGNVPEGQQVNAFTTTAGDYYELSSIIPLSGTLDQLGFPAVEGDQIQELDSTEENFVTVATYSGGAWTPAAPIISAAQSFLLLSGASTNRNWTENLPPCMPDVTLTNPPDGSIFVGPATITLAATATADAGISNVEFFQGATLLGIGVQSGNAYTLIWTNPPAGNYSITAQATDNDGMTTISIPANITVDMQPGLVSESYSNGDFQFSINGSSGVSVDLEASSNLVEWASLGIVTLPGGSSNYVDAAAGSFTQRFYRVQENGVCSSNTIGFVNVTVPTENSSGGEAYISLANPLNNPAGNTLDVLFWALTNRSQAEIWDSDLQSYIVAGKGGTSPTWNTNLTLNPGMGSAVHAGGTNPIVVTFVGNVPEGQQVNAFTTTAGDYYELSSIIPLSGTLDQLGFPAVEGDQIQELDSTEENFVTVATYSGGAWTPAAPIISAAQSFLLLSGASTNRNWTENLSPCP